MMETQSNDEFILNSVFPCLKNSYNLNNCIVCTLSMYILSKPKYHRMDVRL